MTNLLHINEKYVTIRNICSKIPQSTAMHFATRVRISGVVRLNMCLFLNVNETELFCISGYSSVRFLFVGLDEERNLPKKKGGYTRRIAR